MKKLATCFAAASVMFAAVVVPAQTASATAPVTCRTGAHYSNGTVKFNICFDHLADDDGDGDWTVSRVRVQNAHPANGGANGDVLTEVCRYNSTTTCGGGSATDGQTLILGVWSSIPNRNTYWVTVKGRSGGGNSWCHKVYLNIGGGTAIINC